MSIVWKYFAAGFISIPAQIFRILGVIVNLAGFGLIKLYERLDGKAKGLLK